MKCFTPHRHPSRLTTIEKLITMIGLNNVLIYSAAVLAICAGCGRQADSTNASNGDTTAESQTTWLQRLTNSRSLILAGQWNKAEVAWDELKRGVRTKEEIN